MTQTELLKKHFDSGGSLTVFTAPLKLGICALSQRCGELKRAPHNYPVRKEWLYLPSGKRVISYSKEPQDLQSRVRAA